MNENSSSESQRKWWQWLLMYPTLLITIFISAIPTYIELYNSFVVGGPFGLSKCMKQQNELWEKNFDCLMDQEVHEAITRHNVKVGIIVCPSGDVLCRVKAPEIKEQFRWIARSTFGLDKRSSINRLISEALAANLSDNERLVQARDVLCQRWVKKGELLRRVRDPNGQCFDEIINTYKGILIRREPAPCNSNC